MQRAVSVGCIDAVLEQPRCQIFAGGTMPLEAEPLIVRLAPRVPGPVLPWPDLVPVISQHCERRDNVLLEILVLVVAEHDDDIRLELIQRSPRLGKVAAEDLARLPRCGGPEI